MRSVHPKVRLGQAHSCVLVLMGVRQDSTKELIALAEGLRESPESWADLLRDCRRRGMRDPDLVVGDGAMGLWKAQAEVFSASCHQRCWVHRSRKESSCRCVVVLIGGGKEISGRAVADERRWRHEPSCSTRGRVSRTTPPIAERLTSPRASTRTSRLHSLGQRRDPPDFERALDRSDRTMREAGYRHRGTAPNSGRRVGHNGAVREDEEAELLERVRALRAAGSGPKQVARALGLRPARAGALLRRAADAEQAATAPGERAVVGCWVNAGWSTGLDLSVRLAWAAQDAGAGEDAMGAGFAQLLVARRERASRVTVCGLLVDVYCLGVKNVIEPQTIGEGSLQAHRRSYYSAFDEPSLPIPIEQAQAIAYGAVSYARGLGFEPAPGFADAAAVLGELVGELPTISFGREGLPFHINGPRDDAHTILATLERTCGTGKYHYLLASGPM